MDLDFADRGLSIIDILFCIADLFFILKLTKNAIKPRFRSRIRTR